MQTLTYQAVAPTETISFIYFIATGAMTSGTATSLALAESCDTGLLTKSPLSVSCYPHIRILFESLPLPRGISATTSNHQKATLAPRADRKSVV